MAHTCLRSEGSMRQTVCHNTPVLDASLVYAANYYWNALDFHTITEFRKSFSKCSSYFRIITTNCAKQTSEKLLLEWHSFHISLQFVKPHLNGFRFADSSKDNGHQMCLPVLILFYPTPSKKWSDLKLKSEHAKRRTRRYYKLLVLNPNLYFLVYWKLQRLQTHKSSLS